MAAPTLTAEVVPGSAAITDIVSFTYRSGRATMSEPYSSAQYTLTVRNPQNLPGSLVLEARVKVDINGYSIPHGYVTNIEYQYGEVANMDTATITMEGYLSFIGRGYLNLFVVTQESTGENAFRLGNNLSGSTKSITSVNTRSICRSSNYSGDAYSLLQQLIATEQGRLLEQSTSLLLKGRNEYTDLTASPFFYTTAKFTDVNPGTNGIAYDQIGFASLSDNYFTQITVNPDGLATQQAGTGSRNLQVSTRDVSTTQADDLADYMLAQFAVSQSVPMWVTTRHSLANAFDPVELIGFISAKIPITFRGTTYQTILEGYSVTATPEDVRYTFNVSSFQQNNFLVLDDPVYGVLDTARVGF